MQDSKPYSFQIKTLDTSLNIIYVCMIVQEKDAKKTNVEFIRFGFIFVSCLEKNDLIWTHYKSELFINYDVNSWFIIWIKKIALGRPVVNYQLQVIEVNYELEFSIPSTFNQLWNYSTFPVQ